MRSASPSTLPLASKTGMRNPPMTWAHDGSASAPSTLSALARSRGCAGAGSCRPWTGSRKKVGYTADGDRALPFKRQPDRLAYRAAGFTQIEPADNAQTTASTAPAQLAGEDPDRVSRSTTSRKQLAAETESRPRDAAPAPARETRPAAPRVSRCSAARTRPRAAAASTPRTIRQHRAAAPQGPESSRRWRSATARARRRHPPGRAGPPGAAWPTASASRLDVRRLAALRAGPTPRTCS